MLLFRNLFRSLFWPLTGRTGEPPVPPTPVVPTILTSELFPGDAGIAWAQQITASGTKPMTFSATGMPAGMTISPSGLISWDNPTQGTFSITITATNSVGSDTKTYSLFVSGTMFNGLIIRIENAIAQGFEIGCSGNFQIDWGDGSPIEIISKTTVLSEQYIHTYPTTGKYEIKITGAATGYNSSNIASTLRTFQCISAYALNVKQFEGDITQLFPVLGTSINQIPTFQNFLRNTKVIEANIQHTNLIPAAYQFNNFAYDINTLLKVPIGMFMSPGLTGAVPVSWLNQAFRFTSISGIMPRLGSFNGSVGNTAYQNYCTNTNISGIADKVFGEITGTIGTNAFTGAFASTPNLLNIDIVLFDYTGTPNMAAAVFTQIFYELNPKPNRIGKSPSVNLNGTLVPLYTMATATTNIRTFTNNTALSDFATIPANWGGGGA